MLERAITALQFVDPAGLDNLALRERLKASFTPGATRRMTLLGMMVGSAIQGTGPDPVEALVYSSEYGESIALEGYLKSFPTPSPTFFQSSIHPSALQQGRIQQQRPVPEVLPLAGGPELVLQAALAALTNPAPDLIWCGGDERGTWLRELGVAGEQSFAFALRLNRNPAANSLGRIRLAPSPGTGTLALADWFTVLRDRRPWSGLIGEGWQLSVVWT